MNISADRLHAVIVRIFAAAGSNETEANCMARHLVEADLSGHATHGAHWVKNYIVFRQAGKVSPNQHVVTVFENNAIAVLDGNRGYGQIIGEEATAILAEKAKASGIALMTLRNVGHLGMLADFARQLAQDGLVSLHFLNTTGLGMFAAPFRGSDRRLSLNPVAIGFPVAGQEPAILDITTAAVVEAVAAARDAGASLPPDMIIDKNGRPSTNPDDFFDGGSLMAIGGHKGYGLNLMIDLLSGALSGGGCTAPDIHELVNSLTSIAIQPAVFADMDIFRDETRRLLDWVKASPPATPGKPVLLPGEIEVSLRAEQRLSGIPLSDATWNDLLETAVSLGIERNEIEALAGR